MKIMKNNHEDQIHTAVPAAATASTATATATTTTTDDDDDHESFSDEEGTPRGDTYGRMGCDSGPKTARGRRTGNEIEQ